MINLLSRDQTKQLHASIINNTIARYVFLLIGTLLAIGLSTGIIYIATLTNKNSMESQLEEVKTQLNQFAKTKQKFESLRNNLKTAETIIDNQVNYSKLLTAFSSILPSGVTISTIAIDTNTILSPHTAQINAADYNQVIATKQAMLHSKLIETVSIDALDTGKEGTKANITYTFSKSGLAEVIK
ncbi:MAG: hypothetical protein Q3996_00060 [Candidatus Saccharibacteria bacterium]|nr:hypothetical protein [Candidatus Saccharibacteria bacterium]